VNLVELSSDISVLISVIKLDIKAMTTPFQEGLKSFPVKRSSFSFPLK
jgi:hypothetical protein